MLFASQEGTSHSASGVPCQDDCWASVEEVDGAALLTIFVADGAGSASRGHDGAQNAVREAIAFVTSRAHDDLPGLFTETSGRDLVNAVRGALTAQSDNSGIPIREYACTFLAVLSSAEHGTLAVQIGDGGIVLDFGNGLFVPIEPMGGEYANATRFVTEADAHEIVEVRHYDKSAVRAAAFTDGLEPLALNQAENTAHPRFFAPFFDSLSSPTTPDEEFCWQDRLTGALVRFLNSDAVNSRTDDDKTLALAVHQGEKQVVTPGGANHEQDNPSPLGQDGANAYTPDDRDNRGVNGIKIDTEVTP
ncbi:protein phosphatase 2C domain-containing protein [Georgenia sp. EYE_87]|uniref:PP2C family serine/threonine-protein phosphatase n=1 Tax=Georgenia sp. EYE_87 TaxID=2853448 RepID=UPI002006789E|nr:PP2C family serine/threonine-protein phosphatase [Georgenia sp. EYE_87]MCK6211342.1 protein phosphatase 2C domain-containing protein [Georgenia sp. EYE_87]